MLMMDAPGPGMDEGDYRSIESLQCRLKHCEVYYCASEHACMCIAVGVFQRYPRKLIKIRLLHGEFKSKGVLNRLYSTLPRRLMNFTWIQSNDEVRIRCAFL